MQTLASIPALKKAYEPAVIVTASAKAADVAHYAAAMLTHLSKMARGVELNTLAYLIDMARLEAEDSVA